MTDDVMRVLVVDDVAADRDPLVAALERLGFAVEGVASASAAIESAREAAVGVVVLDLTLDETTGVDTVDAVASRIDAPIVVWTGDDSADAHGAAVAHGASRVLVKPTRTEDVRRAIVEVVGERRRARRDADLWRGGLRRVASMFRDAGQRVQRLAGAGVGG